MLNRNGMNRRGRYLFYVLIGNYGGGVNSLSEVEKERFSVCGQVFVLKGGCLEACVLGFYSGIGSRWLIG